MQIRALASRSLDEVSLQDLGRIVTSAGAGIPLLTMCDSPPDLARKLHPKIGTLVRESASQEELSV